MNILLIKPPFNPNLISKSIYEPLELEYLAATVSEHRIKILDMRLVKNLMRSLRAFKPDVACITAYSCDIKTAKSIFKEIKKFDDSIHTIVGGIHATFIPSDFERLIFMLFVAGLVMPILISKNISANLKSVKMLKAYLTWD